MNEVTVLFGAFSKDLDRWNRRSIREEERHTPHLYPVAGPQQEHPGSMRVLPPADAVCILADKPQALLVGLQLVHLQACEGQEQPLRTARSRVSGQIRSTKNKMSAPSRTTSNCWVGLAHRVVERRICKQIIRRQWAGCLEQAYPLGDHDEAALRHRRPEESKQR